MAAFAAAGKPLSGLPMKPQYKIIIVHGTLGSPSENWFPWLRKELLSLGCDVSVPRFPSPIGQSFLAWRAVLAETNIFQKEQTLLIGHSIGAPFVLRMAEETSDPYKAVLAVCPFATTLGIEDFDDLNATFVDHDFDWKRIHKGAIHRLCFAGDNDPYVPLTLASDVAKKAGASLEVIHNGGHLNAASGFSSFPMLLRRIKALL